MKDNFFSEEVMSGNFLETIQIGSKANSISFRLKLDSSSS